MYLTEVKTLLTKAMRDAFVESVEPDFANLYISIEYPVSAQHYPSIWVDFDPSGALQTAGIGHVEYDTGLAVRRWRFTGSASYTVVALSSFERDRMFDEVVRILAFNQNSAELGTYRRAIEDNQLIAVNVDFDQIDQRGFAAAQGTPWNTDEMIYEATIGVSMIGEFVSSSDGVLVNLSAVVIIPIEDGSADPTTSGGWIG